MFVELDRHELISCSRQDILAAEIVILLTLLEGN